MTIRTTLAAGIAALLATTAAYAEPVKIGMITTLSGGGAGLGIDVRDGFLLALKQAGDAGAEVEVITEDDQQKPDVAVQIADKMIQSDNVDILTGIIFSNIALAVVPAAVKQGKFYLSPNAGPSQLAGKGCDANYFNVAEVEPRGFRGLGQAEAVVGQRIRVARRGGRTGRLAETADEERREQQPHEEQDDGKPGVAGHGLFTPGAAASCAARSASRTGSEVTYLVWYLAKSSRCWR